MKVIISLGALIVCFASGAHAAEVSNDQLYQLEQRCEKAPSKTPFSECMRTEIRVSLVASGQAPSVIEEYLAYPPMVAYFSWLDENVRPGKRSAHLLARVRLQTERVQISTLQLYVAQLSAAYTSLYQQFQDSQAQLGKLQAAQSTENERREKFKEFIQLMQVTKPAPPSYVTCNSQDLGNGTRSTSCY